MASASHDNLRQFSTNGLGLDAHAWDDRLYWTELAQTIRDRAVADLAATIAGSAADKRIGPRDRPNPKHPSLAQPQVLHCDGPNPKRASPAQPPSLDCANPKDPYLDFPAQH